MANLMPSFPVSFCDALRRCVLQKCLKKSEWETTPEGYRDPAHDKKLPDADGHKTGNVVEQAGGDAAEGV